jgi:ABC-type antimicrobial peptide transport system permease subunit
MDGPRVAIISETLAKRVFPGEDPIGKRITVGVMGPAESREIVGIVSDVRPTALDSEPRPELFVPFAQSGNGSVTFVVRALSNATALTPLLKTQIWSAVPSQSIYYTATVESLVGETLVERRFQLILLAAFSGVALVLSAIGLYGLINYTTVQRRNEIGVRMALGARASEIVTLILRQGIRVAIPGVALGLIGAVLLSHFMRGMLYRIPAVDPVTYAELAALMLVIAAGAAFVPALRATRLDPISSLRED